MQYKLNKLIEQKNKQQPYRTEKLQHLKVFSHTLPDKRNEAPPQVVISRHNKH